MDLGRRLASSYHGLFHVAQATLHYRWGKRIRLIAFLAASSIAAPVVLRNLLGSLGLRNLAPSSLVTLLVACVVWLAAHPAMWLRMLTVLREIEARREFTTALHEIEKLYPRRRPRRRADARDRR